MEEHRTHQKYNFQIGFGSVVISPNVDGSIYVIYVM